MRLLEVYISDYKNLKDFSVRFDGTSFIDVFVGKNGTGKSNFFEALLEIFKHLLEDEYIISFNYKLSIDIGDNSYFYEWKDTRFLNNQEEEIRKPPLNILPENILLYYSGHNPTVSTLIKNYLVKYKDSLNRNRNKENFESADQRKFIGIGPEFKSLLLSVLLLQEENLKAREFIFQKLSISEIGPEIRIVFKRPDFALERNEFQVKEFLESTNDKRFWGTEGFMADFMDKLYTLSGVPNPPVREEGYINPGDNINDRFILFRTVASFKEEFNDSSGLDLFLAFDNLKTIGILESVSIEITLNSGQKANINQFSDGQFQSIYIYSITELFKDRNCITLLDEPDAFLHPEWQHKFLEQVFEICNESSESNHVLMTSHSAITLIKHSEDRIRFFDFKDDQSIRTYPLPKRLAIRELSSNLINYCEQDSILSIINTIQIENKPVLFTEGKTDPIYIKVAWEALFPEDEIPFIPFYGMGHTNIPRLLKDESIRIEMDGLPIFGLFDFDKGFNSWNGFSTNDVETDPYKGLIKKLNDHESYALMIPVPQGKPMEAQVLNPTGGNWGENSVLGIEHLFQHIPGITERFQPDQSIPTQFQKFTGDKVTFAKEIVPTIDDEHFEIFRPMFEFIISKI